jgi:hypothetical protein
MKLSTSTIVVLVAVFIIVLSTVCGCASFVPYSENTIFSKEYPYEGFTATHHAEQYGNSNTNKVVDSYQSFLTTGDNTDCKKIYGFDGLYCKPYVADNKIDAFGDTEGSLNCIAKSSGLSNSRGGLCLSETQKQLLMTRGGNQTGTPMQIGH